MDNKNCRKRENFHIFTTAHKCYFTREREREREREGERVCEGTVKGTGKCTVRMGMN